MGCHARALGYLRLPQLSITSRRAIASKTSHEERTAADRREPGMHTVVLSNIRQMNLNVRLLKLQPRGDTPKARELVHGSNT